LRDIAIAYELAGADAIDGFTREQLASAVASAVISRAQHGAISESRPAH